MSHETTTISRPDTEHDRHHGHEAEDRRAPGRARQQLERPEPDDDVRRARGRRHRAWKTATASTEPAAQSVDARAPHFVLPLQKSAATSSGKSAA